MRWITLITSVIFTFSSLGAQEYSISPNSPFFNKIVESPKYNSPKPLNPIRVSALTFNRVFICSPLVGYLWIVTDRNDVVSDIDGNGLKDIPFTSAYEASWDSFPGRAFVAFQTSPGNFQCVSVSNNHNTPYGISVVDFNGDGKKDLVFSTARNNAVFRLINNGGWSFTEQLIGLGGGFPNHLAVRNVDAGPGAEILYTDEYHYLYKYNFLSNSLTTLNTECMEGLIVADINNDGNQDIVCGTSNAYFPGYLKFQLNLGGSSWSSLYLLNNQSRRWHGIKTGDFNKDGRIDVASCSIDDRSVHIFYNNGGNPPTFTEAAVVYIEDIVSNSNYCELTVADLDCDGDYDIVWTTDGRIEPTYTHSLGYLENGYPSNIWTNYIIEPFLGYSSYGAVVSDINNDKKPDIIAAMGSGLSIYYNTSNIDTAKCAPITPVDISEIRPKTNIFINKNEVSISFDQPVNGLVSLYEISGRKVLNKKLDNQKVSFRVDKQGIYIIEINTDKLKQKQTILIK
jgi:hypothetical protein